MTLALSPAVATRAGILTSLTYAALFTAAGAHLPYWPVWLADWGLTTAEVGRWLGLALIARLVGATLLPMLADRLALRRALGAGLAFLAALLFALHLAIGSREVLLAATLAAAFLMSPLIPLTEALGIRASAAHGIPYAHTRVAGSIAFLASVTALGAVIQTSGPSAALWTIVAGFSCLALLTAVHPGGGAPAGRGIDSARLAESAGLLCQPVFLLFAIAAAVGQASHAVYYVYGSLNWQAQGIPTGTIGLLWAIGVVAEIVLMLGPGRRLTERIGAPAMLALGTGAGVVRWGLMALEPAVWALWPVQVLHALTFGAGHLGAMAFIAAAIPARLAASAQGLFAGGLGGAAIALATLAAAEIGAYAGPASAYWLAAAMSGAAFLAALALGRLWQGGLVVR